MKYYQIIVCLTLFLQLQTLNVFAEFYKYKDSNGVLRFTDTLSEVPENQRKQVDKYQEYVPPTKTPEDISNVQEMLKTSPAPTLKTSEKQKEQKDQKSLQIQVIGSKISKINEQLEKEYKELLAKKKRLEDLDKKPGKKKSTAIANLNEQAKLLNKSIKAYNQKKAAYLQAIKGYQEKIKDLSLEVKK
ncbi:hypothetical protein MHK_010313 [Candidatus Magnetomorum sp. HK-1]|nr:hypothetical protein MHK_010313 [Candidatus Magnetomorum sp. HK-1]